MGLCSAWADGREGERKIQFLEEAFERIFDSAEVKERKCNDFPYEVSTMIDGVKIFAICKEIPEKYA